MGTGFLSLFCFLLYIYLVVVSLFIYYNIITYTRILQFFVKVINRVTVNYQNHHHHFLLDAFLNFEILS